MPFLLPALVALSSDAVVLVLGRRELVSDYYSSLSSFTNNNYNYNSEDNNYNNNNAFTLLIPSTNSSSNSTSYNSSSTSTNSSYNSNSNYNNYSESETETDSSWVYRVYYLVFLALIRVLLVLLPLLFHSYTGTALRFPKLYQLFYGGTLIFILVHMLCLSLLNPKSLQAIIPVDYSNADDSEELYMVHELRRIWWILTLSLLSNICHWVMLLHVKSSAPYHPLLTGKKKYPSVYFTLRSQQQQQQQRRRRRRRAQGGEGNNNFNNKLLGGESMSSLLSSNGRPAIAYDSDQDHDSEDYDTDNDNLLMDDDDDDNYEEEEPALMHAMSDFVEEMRVRLQRTQADWAARLEDFTARHYPPDHHYNRAMRSIHQNNPLALSTLTPFRVLLQLFADEESVMMSDGEGDSDDNHYGDDDDDNDTENGMNQHHRRRHHYRPHHRRNNNNNNNRHLDIVFDMDNGSSMTFFVPQLLSFLLHGALRKSQSLEHWILDKCSRNVHFAHRCYWFLRSWCLEQQQQEMLMMASSSPNLAAGMDNNYNNNNSSSINSLSRPNSDGNLILSFDLSNRGSAAAGGGIAGVAPFLDEPAQPTSHLIPCGPRSRRPLLSSSSSSNNNINNNNSSSRDSLARYAHRSGTTTATTAAAAATEKLLPEERAMIERLMMRVKECGETAAEVLAYGLPTTSSSNPNDMLWEKDTHHHATQPAGSFYGSDASTTSTTAATTESYQQQPKQPSAKAVFDTSRNIKQQLIHTLNNNNELNSNGLDDNTNNNYYYHDNIIVNNNNNNNNCAASPSSLMTAVEMGFVPVDPNTGFPSVKHLDSISAKSKFGFLPLTDESLQIARLSHATTTTTRSTASATTTATTTNNNNNSYDNNTTKKTKNARQILPPPPPPSGPGPGAPFPPLIHRGSSGGFNGRRETAEFDKTPQFLDALLYLADSLFSVPVLHRKEELVKQLRAIECELLPSNSIYVPIGNVHHRVWRIVAEESVCIGTKERVPCIICLEVVDYAPPITGGVSTNHNHTHNNNNNSTNPMTGSSQNNPKRPVNRPRAWNFLDRLQQQQEQRERAISNGSGSNGESLQEQQQQQQQQQAEASPGPNRRSTIEGIELPDMVTASATATTNTLDAASSSEIETINEWRYGRRDPLRRLTIFDKVTSSVRGSMKGLGPLDKMKTQILLSAYHRDVQGAHTNHHHHHHHHHHHDRPSDEELLSLNFNNNKTNINNYMNKKEPPKRARSQNGATLLPPSPPLPTKKLSIVTGANIDNDDDADLLVGRSISCSSSAAAVAVAPKDDSSTPPTAAAASSSHHDPENLSLLRDSKRPPLPVREQRPENTTTLPMTNTSTTTASSSTSVSRNNSTSSLASMGQWTSPRPSSDGRTIVQVPDIIGSVTESGAADGLSLQYGTDQDEDLTAPITTIGNQKHNSDKYAAKNNQKLNDYVSSCSKGATAKSSVGASGRRPPVVFRESWQSKQDRLRSKSAYGNHPGWRILPILIKANDDLRQEQLASQLIYRMAAILSREKVPVWLCPYEIIALTENGGIIEAIPDTISLDSLKRNDPNFRGLKYFFLNHFGEGTEEFADAQANFVESLAAYSIVCFLLQLKDRHNGNILLDNRGHIIHIDFGFFFLSSPGKNVGFESAPFKLTRDFVELLGGPNGRLFKTFRELCIKTFLTLRKHCMEIILLVEMLKTGNEDLNCFRGRPDEAIRQLRERFRLDLNDRACREYVNCLVDDSIENWRTDWYDRYQRYFVGVL